MSDRALVVFTAKNRETIIEAGGTSADRPAMIESRRARIDGFGTGKAMALNDVRSLAAVLSTAVRNGSNRQ